MSKPGILSSIPGRVRVHLPLWSGNGQRRLERYVRTVAGVKRVETNRLTRNVLIGFDPRITDESNLLSALNAVDWDGEGLPGDKPLPPVIDEAGAGHLHHARIAVRGPDRDPRVAGKVLERLRNLMGVRVRASQITGRILVEYDADKVDLHELLARVADVELPDLPGEDRPAHPLDTGPLLHAAARTVGAALGLALIVARRLAGWCRRRPDESKPRPRRPASSACCGAFPLFAMVCGIYWEPMPPIWCLARPAFSRWPWPAVRWA